MDKGYCYKPCKKERWVCCWDCLRKEQCCKEKNLSCNRKYVPCTKSKEECSIYHK